MKSVHGEPIPSRVAIRHHPLHPMVVVFPVAFFMAAPVTDMLFWLREDPFWARLSFWLLAAGFVTGCIAALLGLLEFLLVREVRGRLAGWTHMLAAIAALAFAGVNARLRFDDPVEYLLPWGFALSATLAVMTGVAGWIGGTLTFGHGIGTYVHPHDARGNRQDLSPDSGADGQRD